MARSARFQRFTKRFRNYKPRFRRPTFSRRRRSSNRRRVSPMKKYIMYAVVGFLVFFVIKNKQKVTDFFKKITGKK